MVIVNQADYQEKTTSISLQPVCCINNLGKKLICGIFVQCPVILNSKYFNAHILLLNPFLTDLILMKYKNLELTLSVHGTAEEISSLGEL